MSKFKLLQVEFCKLLVHSFEESFQFKLVYIHSCKKFQFCKTTCLEKWYHPAPPPLQFLSSTCFQLFSFSFLVGYLHWCADKYLTTSSPGLVPIWMLDISVYTNEWDENEAMRHMSEFHISLVMWFFFFLLKWYQIWTLEDYFLSFCAIYNSMAMLLTNFWA